MVGFDEYDRKARLTPGLLAVSPFAFLIVTLGWKQYPAVGIASGVVCGAGGTYLLAILVRHFGRRVESSLWESWGGPPTTTNLSLTVETDNEIRRGEWRRALELATGITLPSLFDEQTNRQISIQIIETAVGQVTTLGQNPDHPLVKAENIQYGFERNYYGIRWIGRASSLVCVAGLSLALILGPHRFEGNKVSISAVVAGLIIDILFAISWFIFPSRNRIRLAANRYANQLLQAVVRDTRSASREN